MQTMKISSKVMIKYWFLVNAYYCIKGLTNDRNSESLVTKLRKTENC